MLLKEENERISISDAHDKVVILKENVAVIFEIKNPAYKEHPNRLLHRKITNAEFFHWFENRDRKTDFYKENK